MDEPEVFNKHLYWWTWQYRKVALTTCAVSTEIAVYQYCKYNVVNHQLLLQIQKHSMQIMMLLTENEKHRQ
jgi:hypothetical protein